jgi:hypothetical protein
LFGAGLAGAAAMRRRRRKLAAAAVIASALSIVGTTGANATPIATYGPVDGTLDMNLTGLTLSDSRPMIFNYQLPGLANFGDLASNFSLNATETGAIAFGPIALASFDGSFSFAYAGPDITVGSVTIHTGDDLLSGSFLGSVLTGYGSTAGLVDSVLGGGLVSFNNNSFVTFTGLGDEALSMSLTDLSSPTVISAGALSPFSGNSQGIFSADEIATNACGNSGDLCKIPPTNVPEPFTFTLFGAGFVAAMRRRKQRELTR